MKHKMDRGKSRYLGAKSEAKKLKERLNGEKGKRFKHSDFYAIDPEGQVLERTYHETGETVQVHLTKSKKLRLVYLIRSG